MAHRHVFRADDYLTCSSCFDFRIIDGLPYCREDRIRYNPCKHGCAGYGAAMLPSDAPEDWTLTVGQAEQVKRFIADRTPGKVLEMVNGEETLTIRAAQWLRDDSHLAAIWTVPDDDDRCSTVIDVSTIRYNPLTNAFDFAGSMPFSLRLPEECRQDETRTPLRTRQITLEEFA